MPVQGQEPFVNLGGRDPLALRRVERGEVVEQDLALGVPLNGLAANDFRPLQISLQNQKIPQVSIQSRCPVAVGQQPFKHTDSLLESVLFPKG